MTASATFSDPIAMENGLMPYARCETSVLRLRAPSAATDSSMSTARVAP
ncbi:Uncharacterised protein [Mycobacteroides abscessus subsp. abscessus]|nr:Uncharacterised protein [Mycobacteroides abscessus subsp. abscessus]SIM75300.1 Uncharacterised protein [Mycobacteroides abscessus subsp. abscessus]